MNPGKSFWAKFCPAEGRARYREITGCRSGLSCKQVFSPRSPPILDKPRGLCRARTRKQRRGVVAQGPSPFGFIFGVGPRHAGTALSQTRVFARIGDLQRADEIELIEAVFQATAAGCGRAWAPRPIDDRAGWCRIAAPRTISSETTFETDISDFATLEKKLLWRLVGEKSRRGLKHGETRRPHHHAEAEDRRISASAPARSRSPRRRNWPPRFLSVSREMLGREIDGTAFRLMGHRRQRAAPQTRKPTTTDMLDPPAPRACRTRDGRFAQENSARPAVIRGDCL